MLIGGHPVSGRYICTVCGFCCMHHEGPICEEANWFYKAISGCRLCPGPFRLDLAKPRWTFDQGRYNGMQAQNVYAAPPYGKYVMFMAELQLPAIVPPSDLNRLTYRAASDKEKLEALRGIQG